MSEEAIYTFLPWVRRGISNSITSNPESGKMRAELEVGFKLNSSSVSNTVQLFGPGDIIGISKNEIVRCEPRNWIRDFEPNYLAFVEFYDEDFPWRYSPTFPKDHKLCPWLHLLILKEDEFKRPTPSSLPLPYFELITDKNNVFPDASQTWAWAHVHANKSVRKEEFNSLVKSNPDTAISRLLSCRKLVENTAYTAFLIPAFETGRSAGLGEEISSKTNALDSSWSDNSDVYYPIYYEWCFRTGFKGDFESLVELLEPKEMDSQIGIRDMDVHEPGYGIEDLSNNAIIGLEGALKAPTMESKNFEKDEDKKNFEIGIKKIINLQEDLKENGTDDIEKDELIISPPLYGQWHALVNRLEIDASDDNWVNTINKNPSYRTASGLGTKVIKKYQEKFMKIAWEEVGDVLSVNQKIRYIQLAMYVSDKLYSKHIKKSNSDVFLQITSPLHTKILASSTTIYKKIKDSKLPYSALSGGFRRLTRPAGNIMKKFNLTGSKNSLRLVRKLNEGKITAAVEKQTPLKIISVENIASQIRSNQDLKIKIPNLSEIADNLLTKNYSSAVLKKIPVNSEFSLYNSDSSISNPVRNKDSAEAANFRKALSAFFEVLEETSTQPKTKNSVDTSDVIYNINESINPQTTFLKRISSIIQFNDLESNSIIPVMSYPDMKQPMYKALRDISTELLVPNLNLIPQNTISILETNQPFIEAYMVGLNHEFARELLWREYPTDQRGSYFRQFWDTSIFIDTENLSEEELEEKLRDITPIHTWEEESKLGKHNNRTIDEGENDLVLVVRGEVLKKYPNTVVYAQKAKWDDDNPVLILDDTSEDKIKYPIYSAKIDPDITFLGFDIKSEDAKGDIQSETEEEKKREGNKPGWFFILQEIPGEPRFGLDVKVESPGNVTNWDDLSWDHLNLDNNCIDIRKNINANVTGDIQWGNNAADMAYILFQKPMMVAVHAREMLKNL